MTKKDGIKQRKSWRPEDWENPYPEPQFYPAGLVYRDVFEAGADAMLEATKQKAIHLLDILIDLSEKDISRDMAYDRISYMLWGEKV